MNLMNIAIAIAVIFSAAYLFLYPFWVAYINKPQRGQRINRHKCNCDNTWKITTAHPAKCRCEICQDIRSGSNRC